MNVLLYESLKLCDDFGKKFMMKSTEIMGQHPQFWKLERQRGPWIGLSEASVNRALPVHFGSESARFFWLV